MVGRCEVAASWLNGCLWLLVQAVVCNAAGEAQGGVVSMVCIVFPDGQTPACSCQDA